MYRIYTYGPPTQSRPSHVSDPVLAGLVALADMKRVRYTKKISNIGSADLRYILYGRLVYKTSDTQP